MGVVNNSMHLLLCMDIAHYTYIDEVLSCFVQMEVKSARAPIDKRNLPASAGEHLLHPCGLYPARSIPLCKRSPIHSIRCQRLLNNLLERRPHSLLQHGGDRTSRLPPNRCLCSATVATSAHRAQLGRQALVSSLKKFHLRDTHCPR